MSKKKIGLILLVCLSFCFPIKSLAADSAATEVGIGFADEEPKKEDPKKEEPKKDDPTQTSESGGNAGTKQNSANGLSNTRSEVTTYEGKKSLLPRTGERNLPMISMLGFGCIVAVFWSSLYFRMKKEGNHDHE